MSRRVFLFALIVVGLLVVAVYQAKYQARGAAREIVRVETRIAEAEARLELLEAERAHLGRREWIEVYARERLGMAPARAVQFVTPEALARHLAAGQKPPPPPEGADGEAGQ